MGNKRSSADRLAKRKMQQKMQMEAIFSFRRPGRSRFKQAYVTGWLPGLDPDLRHSDIRNFMLSDIRAFGLSA
jgi:hypothetical protein